MTASHANHILPSLPVESYKTYIANNTTNSTTATAIRATLLYIIATPNVLSRLLDEISSSHISSPITDSEARKMPYLQAVIKEGLRIYPPVTGFMYKLVPPGGETFNGIFIPENTEIGWATWAMMRDPKVWGADVKIFRPDRWLIGSPEEIKMREVNADLVFGYGKWQCLGMSIAKLELNKVFVEVCVNL
jgi:cytochrome P450